MPSIAGNKADLFSVGFDLLSFLFLKLPSGVCFYSCFNKQLESISAVVSCFFDL